MSLVDLEKLAELPALISALSDRIVTLEAKLAPSSEPEQLLTAVEAAKLLSLSVAAIRQAAYRGTIPCVRVGRRLRFKRSELLR